MKYADGGAAPKNMKQVAKKEVTHHEAKMHGKKMANGGMAMPAQANMGGAMRGKARAAEMSGRAFADGGMACGHRGAQDYGKKK